MVGQWFKQKYFLDNGLINLVPGGEEKRYNPFDFYSEGNRTLDNLHHIFASIDTSEPDEVVSFYNDYGPLGIIGRDIMKITRPYNQRGLMVVPHESDELIPVKEFLEDYHVPVNTFGSKYMDTSKIPSMLEVSMYTGESMERFTYHHERFCWVLDMLTALFLNDANQISKLLQDSRPSIKALITSTHAHQGDYNSDAEKHAVAMETVTTHINMELDNRASVKISADNAFRSISNELEWSFDSLLTVMYLMVLMDIQRGVVSRYCQACGRYFETNRTDIQYCSTKCQSRMNTRKHLEAKQLVLNMANAGVTIKEIAAKTGRDVSQIKKWIQQSHD